MTKYTYTQEQIEEAKRYLRLRIESELSMEKDVEILLERYTEILVEMMVGGATESEIEAIIEELIANIISDCYLLGVDTRNDRRDEIMAYMNSERAGDTMEGRVDKRCHTFAEEVGIIVLAGLLLHKGTQEIISSIKSNLKHPYDNELLKEAIEKIEKGEVSGNVKDFEKPSFGQGIEVSSKGALDTITGYAIADAWMWDLFKSNKDANGYFVFRGSSYPCDECDEAVLMGFHPMDDWAHFVPLHPNCKCFVVFV